MFTFGRKPNGRIVEETEMKMTIAQSMWGAMMIIVESV